MKSHSTHFSPAFVSLPDEERSVHWSNSLPGADFRVLPAAGMSKSRSKFELWMRYYWPLILIICSFGTYVWVGQKCASLSAQCKNLKLANDALTQTTMMQAEEAFESGDFRRAEVMMRSVQLSLPEKPGLKLLRAHILECNCRFADAASAYERLYLQSSTYYPEVKNAMTFCRRMASGRHPEKIPSRETLYRLHEELTRRGEHSQARMIAQDLLPDLEPLRTSVEGILRETDGNAMIMPYKDGKRMDVRVNALDQQVLEQFRGLPIHSLVAKASGITTLGIFAGLDIQSLNISRNQLGDISSLRSLPLDSLDISDCPVADVSALAGLPLRSLNLSHTNVSALYPLVLCPLEELGLAGLPVRDLTPLQHLYLRSLDLSHTRVDDISMLSRLPLEILHLDSSRVRSLAPLAGMKLKTLTLSSTQVSDLTPLEGMPLVKLDLRGCPQVTDLTPLLTCVKLEELHLPKSCAIPAPLLHMPRLRIITH